MAAGERASERSEGPAEPGISAGQRRRWPALILVLCLCGFYLFVALKGPTAVGLWVDDAIYIATAQSLAAGDGYRHPELPGEPLQRKYPIGYPVVLALVLWGAPDYPANLPWLLAPTALGAACLVLLSGIYWRRVLGVEGVDLLMLAVLAALAPQILSMVRFAMSDLFYAPIALAGILCLDWGDVDALSERRRRRLVLAAGLLLGFAALTRSIGLACALGAFAFLAWRRRFSDTLWLATGLGLLLLPWWLHPLWAADLGAELDAIPMLASEISYGVFTPAPAELLRVLQVNLFRVAFGIPYFVFGVPPALLGDALAHRSPSTLALHGLSFAVLLLIAAGFAASARPRLRALHVCFAAYLALTLAYPGGDPYRFLLPWSPFLFFFFLCGARVAGATLAGLSRHLQGRRHFVGQAAAGCLALLLVVFAGLEAVRILGSDEREYYLREYPMDWGEARALEAWIRAETAPSDIIASPLHAGLYLATGRQGHYFWPITDPYRKYYGPERSWWNFFIHMPESQQEALVAEVREKLPGYYRSARVDWYVEQAGIAPEVDAIRRFIVEHPGWLVPRYITPRRRFAVYELQLPEEDLSDGRRTRFEGSEVWRNGHDPQKTAPEPLE
jgi:hypothetical protein